MCTECKRTPLFCILPPYVLESIAHNGTPEQRAVAMKTLTVDTTFRATRTVGRQSASKKRKKAVALATPKNRTIHSAQNLQQLPGVVVRNEGSLPTGDPAIDEAYDGLGATYDFFAAVHGRDSIDDEGLAMIATVHYAEKYNNAFWNSAQMVFGDGDGDLFNRFTIALDIIGHELAHGVTEDESGLVYLFQPGALNEHLSDVFGSLIKQWMLKQTAVQADWLIGAGLFTDRINGVALRSMAAPGTAFDDPLLGKDPQPGHMRDFVRTYEDNGGVHINSGIPNRAFYLAATKLGGYAWERAGRIWYETLLDGRLRSNSGFKRFAGLTVLNAERLYGVNSMEAQTICNAWAEVGIQLC